MSKYK